MIINIVSLEIKLCRQITCSL